MFKPFRWLVLLLLVGGVVGGGYYYGQQLLDRPLNIPEEGLRYELAPGTTYFGMTRGLAEKGIIEYPRLLQWYGRLSGRATDIKAGEYFLAPGMSTRDVLRLFHEGQVIRYQVTLVEGWTFRQAVKHLRSQDTLENRLVADMPLWQQLGIENPIARHPEGLFFPDTYDYLKGSSDTDILRRAYRRMEAVIEEEWAGRDANLPFATPYEALIMASIVEKETGAPDERRRIAGVFVRRLQQNMRLQSDPTVIYGLDEADKKNLRRVHLDDRDNPYNTYRHRGLPPTPIALPGRQAIAATLNPSDGGELYFVAKGDGSHHFSATLEEHLQAVREYQVDKRRSDYRSAPPLNRN